MADRGDFRPPSITPFIEQLREIIARSRELLKEPPPDTFLGRKTQEPFPTQFPEADEQ